MGEFISIGDSLIVTLFSMTMVFVVLVVISVFISFLKNLNRIGKTEESKDDKIVAKSKNSVVEVSEKTSVNDEELVAVISAVIAASMGVSVPKINIKKINRVSGNPIAWATAGMQEQLASKL